MTKDKPHTGHESHLCAMVEDGLTKESKSLMKNAKYVCSCCCRVAKDEDALCSPEKL